MALPVEVTFEMLATKKQRFINVVVDTVVLIVFYLFFILGIVLLYKYADIDKPMFWYKHANGLQLYLVFSFITFLYYTLCEAFMGGTIGKFITHTKVLGQEGRAASFGNIALRSLIRLIPLEGFSFIGEYSTGLHDQISKTVVVDIHRFERESLQQVYANPKFK